MAIFTLANKNYKGYKTRLDTDVIDKLSLHASSRNKKDKNGIELGVKWDQKQLVKPFTFVKIEQNLLWTEWLLSRYFGCLLV